MSIASAQETYLVSVPDGSVDTIHVGNQENGKEEADPIYQTELRGNGLDSLHTGTPETKQLHISAGSFRGLWDFFGDLIHAVGSDNGLVGHHARGNRLGIIPA